MIEFLLKNHANDNKEYPHKEEFVRLAAIVWPTKKKFRWDRMFRSLDNFLYFLRFETQYLNKMALLKREKIKQVIK